MSATSVGSETGGPTTSASTATNTNSGSGDESSSDSSSSGSPAGCNNPDYQCSELFACDDTCGDVDSLFDAQGCLRLACNGLPSDCNQGDVCYRAMDFGGCTGGGTACSDSDGMCQCVSDPECGGQYCVPADIYPVPVEGVPAGNSLGVPFCGPADEESLALLFGADAEECGAPGGSELEISLINFFGDGVYQIGSSGTSATHDGADATNGFISVTSDGASASGEVTLVFETHAVIGTFADVALCPAGPPCG